MSEGKRRNIAGQMRRGSQRNEPKGSGKKIYPLAKDVVPFAADPGGNFNFGLYFNKWLWASKQKGEIKYEFQSKKLAEEVLKRYDSAKSAISSLIKKRQLEFQEIGQAFKKLGYECESFDVLLETPLIIGLGNAHPTERGFTLHWTFGVPYIPAESVKGVVRLAYLVNEATDTPDFFDHWAAEDEVFWEKLKGLFGRAEAKGSAARGEVVFLDAFPVDVPGLTLEITTCHYSEYYSGNRGPTEDQNPNPLPFLAVAQGTAFRFTFLISRKVSDEDKKLLIGAFKSAIRKHGFGAKTALGHGRFSPPEERE